MVFGSHANTRAIYSTPPCPSLAASTAAYRRRSFSDNHPKNRCIFPSISAAYSSIPSSLIQSLLYSKDTTAQAIREVVVDHNLSQSSAHNSGAISPLSGRHHRRGGGVNLQLVLARRWVDGRRLP